MSLHTGVQRGPVGGVVVVVPWASITTWHVWVSFDCISDQLHKQEKKFAPDEWSGSCGANVCVWETELSKACGSCSKEKTLVFCWWWHSFSSQVGMCGLFLTASMISGNNRQIMQSMECRAQSVKKCMKGHKIKRNVRDMKTPHF